MSLINDALKKAQHQRTGGAGDVPPMPGGGAGRRVGSDAGMPKQFLAAIIGGSAALVAVAVVITVLIVNRQPASPVPHSPVATTKPASLPPSSSPLVRPAVRAAVVLPPAIREQESVAIVEPPLLAPAPQPVAAPPVHRAPARVAKPAPPVVAEPVAPPRAPVDASAEPATEDSARGALPNGQDIRILTYIDAIRVAGIRSSGAESKVLMNDKVYRTNDMVDYTLGLRLTRVSATGLTFTDANGATYVKNFQ